MDFLNYFFKTKKGKYLLELASPGGAGRNKTLGQKEFTNLKFPMPGGDEQTKIAQILSTWDKAIETTEKLIENSKAQKKALMQQLLTGKKRFPGFNGGWSDARLGDFLVKIIGGGTPDRSNPQYWGGDIPWATVKDLSAPVIYGAKERITEKGLNNSASNLIPAGSVIVSTRMAVGKTVTNVIDVAINQDLKALVPKKKLLSKYLFFLMHSLVHVLGKLGTGSTVKNSIIRY